MVILVTGVCGQLGHDVMNEIHKRGYEGIGSDIMPEYSGIKDGNAVTTMPYVKLDITDRDAVFETVNNIKPDVIVHCAAWTAVDAAESSENRDSVHKINVEGTQNLAEAASYLGTKMIYLSTDYVFDGQGTRPWKPDDKNYAPLNHYGQTKLEGELAVANASDKFFIVRTSWVLVLTAATFQILC